MKSEELKLYTEKSIAELNEKVKNLHEEKQSMFQGSSSIRLTKELTKVLIAIGISVGKRDAYADILKKLSE